MVCGAWECGVGGEAEGCEEFSAFEGVSALFSLVLVLLDGLLVKVVVG
jgi:hypothetical protein